jgi:hypothetical protein
MNSENFIREEVRKLLGKESNNSRQLNEFLSWGDDDPTFGGGPALNVFGTIFQPFVDVFKVATVALQDIASATMDITKYALTFDEEKRKNLKERFRQRRKKYKDKMKVAFKSTEDIFNNEDVQMLALFAAPGAVFAKKGAEMVWSGAEPLRDQVEEKFGGMLGIGDQDIGASTAADKSPGIMADLKRAFFGEGLDEIDDIEAILLEQEKKEDAGVQPSSADIEAALNDFFESSGMQDDFNAAWDEIISAKKEETASILKEKREQISLLGQLSIADSITTAQDILQQLKAVNIDLSEPFSKVLEELEGQIAAIAAGGPEAEKIIKSLKDHPDAMNISDDADVKEYYPLIEKGLLAQTFGQAVDDARAAGTGELLGFVAEMSKSDLENIAASSPKGKEYSDIIYSFRDELMAI